MTKPGGSDFIHSFICFAQESLDWCTSQSEEEVSRIYNVLKNLTDDSQRRIHFDDLSEKRFKGLMQSINEGNAHDNFDNLHDMVKNLGREDRDLINPIVEALQFQDRLRQKLENIGKMMQVWSQFRENSATPYMVTESQLLEFAAELSKCATTGEERETLKLHIPGFDAGPEIKKSVMF